MIYYLIREQAGEGCDYMIDCGKAFTKLSASTPEAAKEEAIALIAPEEPGWYTNKRHMQNERVLSGAKIVAFVDEIDLDTLYSEWVDIGEAAAEERVLTKEKEEFERLKAKLGK